MMKKNNQINECHKVIENLKGLLKIIGSGSIAIIGLFVYFKEEFNETIAKALLVSTGLIIILILFMIFKKYAIIEELNLGGKNYDN